MKYPQQLLKLMQALRRLPGVGTKSAERFAFHMLEWKPQQIKELAQAIDCIPETISFCPCCGCLLDHQSCLFCTDDKRDKEIMCVVSSAKEVYAIEETRQYKGSYHVLGGLLSPMEGKGPESLKLEKLIQRVAQNSVQEIILAMDATLEGDATALFLKKELARLPLKLSRIAFGLPMGSSFEYIDGSTLCKALSGRVEF